MEGSLSWHNGTTVSLFEETIKNYANLSHGSRQFILWARDNRFKMETGEVLQVMMINIGGC